MATQFPSFESRTVTIDGVNIHYVCGGSGPPLVLVHGLGSSAAVEFYYNLEPLAAHHRVLAIDLPGFGKSDKPMLEYTIDLFVKAVRDLMTSEGVGWGGGVGPRPRITKAGRATRAGRCARGRPAAARARLSCPADEGSRRADPPRNGAGLATDESRDHPPLLGLVSSSARTGRDHLERRANRQPRHAPVDAGVSRRVPLCPPLDRRDATAAGRHWRRGTALRAAHADAVDLGSARPHLPGESRRVGQGQASSRKGRYLRRQWTHPADGRAGAVQPARARLPYRAGEAGGRGGRVGWSIHVDNRAEAKAP